MKDKSRLLSSVIVSLLAGFIYYQFGENIKEFQNSFKAILSSNYEMEQYLPHSCESFNSLITKSESNSKSKRSKFYIKKNFKNTIELKANNLTIPGEDLMSEFIASNQARFQKPQPDKKVDFTQELENLVKSNLKEIHSNDFELNSSIKKSGNEVADLKATRPNNIVVVKDFDKTRGQEKIIQSTGYGFEYNYVTEESLSKTKNNSGKKRGLINENKQYKSDLETKNNDRGQIHIECKTNTVNEKRIKIITPKVKVKSNNETIEIEVPDINIRDEDCDDDM